MPTTTNTIERIEGQHLSTFLAGDTPWEPGNEIATVPFIRLHFQRPDYSDRLRLWKTALDSDISCQNNVALEAIVINFALLENKFKT